MKRKHHPQCSSCSSSSSSSCIDSQITDPIQTQKNPIKPKRVRAKKQQIAHNSATSAKSRSSIYRGVTRHRWTGRFEAHLWDKSTWNNIQNKRGRQIYLGAYDNEEDAARTYDLAALKYWGPSSILNFPVEGYSGEMEEMEKLSKEEYLASLRRRSSGFSRGVSKYRGVARHHHNGRWEARIGRVCGNKYLYLGTYSTQEEAAAAYDMAAIEYRGVNAVTNFDLSNYAHKLNQTPQEAVQLLRHDEEEQVQVKNETNPIPLNQVQPGEAYNQDHQEYPNEFDYDHQSSIPKIESLGDNSMNAQSLSMMDPTLENEHPWDLCLDIGYTILPIPDMPMGIASEVLDYEGFEDNIECIFDGQFDGNEFFLDVTSGSMGQEDATSGSMGQGDELKGQNLSTSPSSSSLSTSTSVCSNV